MATLGRIEEFNPAQGNIDRYLERLGQYFEANGVKEDNGDTHQRRAILISVIGAKTYDVLADLCSPTSPATKSYTDLATILRGHFAPKKLVIAERFRFHNCSQAVGETISSFVANLKRLAATCNFGANLNEALRDRFVCGLSSEAMQRKLLTSEYSFDEALKMALSIETAERDVRELSRSTVQAERPVNKLSQRQNRTTTASSKTNNSETHQNNQDKCLSCGKTGHKRSNCKYKDATCHSCQRKGHIAPACLSKATKRINAQNMHESESESEMEPSSQFDPFTTSLYKLDKHGVEVSVDVNGIVLNMELDTGAGASLISEETYRKHFASTKLSTCPTKLHTYTGESIRVLGQMMCNVNYQNQHAELPVVVVGGTGPSLLGRDWLSSIKLNWQEIFHIKCESSELSFETQKNLQSIIDANAEIFQPGLGTIKGVKAKLELKEGATPKFCKARPVPYSLLEAVEEEYDRLEREGIVEKVEFSDWATPMVHIPKTDHTTRSCGDYAVTVNPQLHVPHYPIPLPEEVFQKLRGGKLFTKLDLKNAYQQLLIDEASLPYVTINTHRGLYRYKRLPFGIASSPAIFQKTIDTVLQGLDSVAAIQDDILVTGSNDAEHLQNLENVLSRLKEYGLRLKLDKCKFMQRSVVFMGCIISADGISPTTEKVDALKQAPRPENITQLRSFLGMVNYHGKWIANLSTIVHPLNRLLQKGQTFVWSKECEKAFQQAKNSLTSDKVLVHYNPDLPLVLECDASPYGIGAVISHRFDDGTEKPIAYASRSLSQAERNYSQIEKEGLAIIFGVTKFYMYLFGRKFTLCTDHKPLLKIFAPDAATPALAAARLQRWSLLLSSYHYDIRYRSSSNIANADALSRLPVNSQHDDVSTEESIYAVAAQQLVKHPVSAQRIATETAHDKTLSRALQLTQQGWPDTCENSELKPFVRSNELSVEQGCLLWGLRVIIPPNLRKSVLEELHSTHAGVSRMKSIARSHFWWPCLDEAIANLASSCPDCCRVRPGPPKSPLHPWTWPTRPWQRVHVDFASYKDQHYLVVVDAHSKWPEVIGPMRSTSANSTADALRSLFGRYGLPEQIVSDNGPPFQSRDYDDFLKQNGVQRILVSPYHQSSNGQAERFIQTFKNFLETSRLQPNSPQKILNFLLSYRSTKHATTGVSPAKLFLGREVRTRLSLLTPNIASRVASKQAEMKSHHDQKNTKQREFSTGDPVFARDYRSKEKWQPGTVTNRSAPHSYTVQLDNEPLTWRRHTDQLLKGSHLPTLTDTAAPAQDSDVALSTPELEPPEGVLPQASDEFVEEPQLRRSSRAVKPPTRFIEEI